MTTTAASSVVFVGDVGTRLTLNCKTDVSAAQVMRVVYKKPDGVTGYWTATLHVDTEKIYYDTQAGDLDLGGKWQFQSYIELPAWKGHGRIAELQIYNRLTD